MSSWEIAIKSSQGKIHLPKTASKFIPEQLEKCKLTPLSIDITHTLATERLGDHHRDPFDRLLVAQSLIEGLPLISNDGALSKYDVELVW